MLTNGMFCHTLKKKSSEPCGRVSHVKRSTFHAPQTTSGIDKAEGQADARVKGLTDSLTVERVFSLSRHHNHNLPVSGPTHPPHKGNEEFL